jgi:hypothetical protein
MVHVEEVSFRCMVSSTRDPLDFLGESPRDRRSFLAFVALAK